MKSIRVGIVEDNLATLEMLTEMVRLADGIQCVSQYPSAEAALRGFPVDRPDVIMVDLYLPRMGGVELIARLKPKLPDSSFLVLTEHDDSRLAFEALKSGATGYLLKRASLSQVVEAIRVLHGGGGMISPSIARELCRYFYQEPKKEALIESLTRKEREVLDLAKMGATGKAIAENMGVELSTVRSHFRNIYAKLEVANRGEAVAKVLGLE